MISTTCPSCGHEHDDASTPIFKDDGQVLCRVCGASCGDLGVAKAPFGPTTATFATLAHERAQRFIGGKPEGWCSQAKAQLLVDLVLEHKPALACEIGVWGGASLIPIALALEQLGKGKVFGIDPWTPADAIEGMLEQANVDWWKGVSYEQPFRSCLAHIHGLGLTGYVEILRARSEDVVGKFADASLGLIHFDGNHSKGVSLRNVTAYWPKLAPGAIAVLDDVNWTEANEKTQAESVDFILAAADKIAECDDGNCHVYRLKDRSGGSGGSETWTAQPT